MNLKKLLDEWLDKQYTSTISLQCCFYFLIFILVLISVIVLMSSWKDSNKFINVEILISNENLNFLEDYCFPIPAVGPEAVVDLVT